MKNPTTFGGVIERPRYFPRQLMTPDELTLEAEYFRDRLRRHNVYLHGWGVVCGALVCVVPADGGGTKPGVVRVQAGYVLGPFGDEILIGASCEVPLDGAAAATADLRDPWCSEVYVERPDGPRYVAVRYRELPVRPVRAQPAGCGCDETPCEYSRYRDGYEIGILDACPDSHAPGGSKDSGTGNPSCPDVPDSPWVVLAEVTVEDDGTVAKINNCVCRRIVASGREHWTTCSGTDCDYTSAAEDPATPEAVFLVQPAPDAAPPDTAPPDTAPPDTAPPDTAPPDTAPPDTAPPDTAPPDTAAPG